MTADPDIAQLAAEMRARAEVATPGEWRGELSEKSAQVTIVGPLANKDLVRPSDGTGPIVIVDCALEPEALMFSPLDQEAMANSGHIVASCPVNILAILDAFDARGREIERLTKERDEAIRHDALESMGLLQDLAARATRAESALAEARRMVETLAEAIHPLIKNAGRTDTLPKEMVLVMLDDVDAAARALADVKGGARDG